MKNKGSVEQQSVKSSSITSDTVSIASCFSKLSMASKRIINKAFIPKRLNRGGNCRTFIIYYIEFGKV